MSTSPRPPPPPAQPRPATVVQALEQAVQASRAQDHAAAEHLAAQVLRADRGNLLAAQVLGGALIAQGRAQDAIAPLQRAAVRSQDPALETLLARALTAVRRGDEALERLRLATTRRPPFPQAFLELGDRLGELGRFDEAMVVFEGGLALTPNAIVLRVGLGYLHLKRNDRAGALAQFQQVRAVAPERRDALLGLARVLTLQGDYAAAADLYRQGLAQRPDDAAARIELGKCLLEMGRREAGEAALKAAARTAPLLEGPTIMALATGPHGRFFLRPSAAAKFLRTDPK